MIETETERRSRLYEGGAACVAIAAFFGWVVVMAVGPFVIPWLEISPERALIGGACAVFVAAASGLAWANATSIAVAQTP